MTTTPNGRIREVVGPQGRYYIAASLSGYPAMVIIGEVVVEDTGDDAFNELIARVMIKARDAQGTTHDHS